MSNTIDIANLTLTDNVFDAVAAVKAGDQCVDIDHLTDSELLAVSRLLGWAPGATLVWGTTDRSIRPMTPTTAMEASVTSGEEYL